MLGAKLQRVYHSGGRYLKNVLRTLPFHTSRPDFKSIETFCAETFPTPKHTSEPVSVIVVSYNRADDTIRSLSYLYRNLINPFEVILFDNGSEPECVKKISRLARKYNITKIILNESNLGCAGGREAASGHASHDLLLFIDNDILLMPYSVNHLISRLHSDAKVAAVCCTVVFPDHTIQFSGGSLKMEGKYAIFSVENSGIHFSDIKEIKNKSCDWIPGGATLWRRAAYTKYPISPRMKGSFEDNEVSMRLRSAGFTLLNSPKSFAIHNHWRFKSQEFQRSEAAYVNARYDPQRIGAALRYFYTTYGKILCYGDTSYPYSELGLESEKEIVDFLSPET